MMNDIPDNQKKDREQRRALVSSLADGQLRGAEFARAVGMVSDSGEARATWHAYHVLGDVLRSGELGACADDAAFVARFQTRLQRDTAGFAPELANPQIATLIVAYDVYGTRASGINSLKIASANESRHRWKLLAGVASVAAVGAIGWSMVAGLGGGEGMRKGEPPTAAQLAQTSAQSQSQSQSQPQVMIRDPHLDALLAAHKQFGGTSALQMPAGFLRNATFEAAAR